MDYSALPVQRVSDTRERVTKKTLTRREFFGRKMKPVDTSFTTEPSDMQRTHGGASKVSTRTRGDEELPTAVMTPVVLLGDGPWVTYPPDVHTRKVTANSNTAARQRATDMIAS